MYRIAILTENEELGKQLARWTGKFWKGKGNFPLIEVYQDAELFYSDMEKEPSCGVIAALPGVKGLNAVEHLRALYPQCRLIWCSDLDFSLHAYRVWADYFILAPVTEAELEKAQARWRES